tara:strand:- start:372 stop:1406 length:1035 start_codon:yes stop_codon:yes gene_type:complete
MQSKKKNQHNDEIDLTELFLIIWKYKVKIILLTIIPAIAMFVYLINKSEPKTNFLASTEVKPISIFDEFEYENYNSYIENTNESIFISISPLRENLEKITNENALILKNVDLYANIDNSSFELIDKSYLLELFVDKLNEQSIFINAIKKFNLLNVENYEDFEAFEDAVMKLASSIKLINTMDNETNSTILNIEFNTENKEKWEKILQYIEESTNKEIQIYLQETFNRLVLNQKRLKQYKIEDINILIQNSDEDSNVYIDHLKILKKDIENNKNIQRLEYEFNSTPIAKPNNFYAARIMVKSTEYKRNNKAKGNQMITAILLSALIGAIIGIFYAMISNSIRNRV